MTQHEALVKHQEIDAISEAILETLNKKIKGFSNSGKEFLLGLSSLANVQAKLLTRYTNDPQTVTHDFLIPDLLERIDLYLSTKEVH